MISFAYLFFAYPVAVIPLHPSQTSLRCSRALLCPAHAQIQRIRLIRRATVQTDFNLRKCLNETHEAIAGIPVAEK